MGQFPVTTSQDLDRQSRLGLEVCLLAGRSWFRLFCAASGLALAIRANAEYRFLDGQAQRSKKLLSGKKLRLPVAGEAFS